MRIKNGKNTIANSDGTLSTETLEMIGGILRFAKSLTAFGNPTSASYLRFIAQKESPTNVCWSFRNRLALIPYHYGGASERKPKKQTVVEKPSSIGDQTPLQTPSALSWNNCCHKLWLRKSKRSFKDS